MPKLFERADTETSKQTIRLFLAELKRDRKAALFFGTTVPLSFFLRNVLTPLLMGFIIQSFVTNPDDATTPIILILAIAVISIIIFFINNKGFTALFNHEEAVSSRLTDMAMRNLMSQSYTFFSNHKVGSLSGDVASFTRSYVSFMDAVFLQLMGIAIGFITSLIIIAVLSPILLLPLLILTVAIIMASVRAYHERSPLRTKRKILTSQLNGTVADILGNQLLVRVFAREQDEIKTTSHDRLVIESVANKEIAIIEKESMIRQSILFTFMILTLLIAVWLSTNQIVSIAALVFTVTYLVRVTDSLFSVTQLIRSFEQSLLDAAPMTRILSQPIELTDDTDAAELTVSKGDIRFDSVNFSYDGAQDEAVFSDLSLSIVAGTKIGLAGRSGGGKTTLTKLLLRFVDIDAGSITIDGQDIAHVTQTSLRSSIAYVPQEPFLFHRSLRDNIAYGNPKASDNQIRDAARRAHALEFIDELPHGLDTVVGERGVKLSGGQRQRIAIARAILKDAPILVLDEATSALDSESEKLIQSSLDELMKGRTSIVIAHRLSTIAKLDRILVLDNGRVVEDGTHARLLKQNGTYAKLWEHQSGGILEE